VRATGFASCRVVSSFASHPAAARRCTPAAEKQLARAVVPISLGQRPVPQGCESSGMSCHFTCRTSHITRHTPCVNPHTPLIPAAAIILAAAGGKDLCLDLIQAVASERAVLVHASAARVDKSKAQQLLAAVGPSAAHVTLSDGEVVLAAQLCGGSTLAQALKAAAQRYGGESGGIVVLDAAAAAAAGQLFFSQWREHSGHAVTK
jgi:hypothetical protein